MTFRKLHKSPERGTPRGSLSAAKQSPGFFYLPFLSLGSFRSFSPYEERPKVLPLALRTSFEKADENFRISFFPQSGIDKAC